MNGSFFEKHWQKPYAAAGVILLPLSWLFGAAAGIRRFLYRSGCLKSIRLPVPVVVVGNIHVGGTGKTPLTAALVCAMRAKGIRTGIVSRGYGRQSRGTVIADVSGSPEEYGDEALMLARQTGAPLAVGRDRAAAGRLLLEKFPDIQLIVADDGLQHYRLARDAEIAVFPRNDPRRAALLPHGALREPLNRLQSVDMVITDPPEKNAASGSAAEKILRRLPENIAVFTRETAYRPIYALHNPQTTAGAAFFRNKKVLAMAAIARPERFFAALENIAGIVPQQTLALPDHADLADFRLPEEFDALITTEKDAVKLTDNTARNIWVLPIYAIIRPDIASFLQKKLWQ